MYINYQLVMYCGKIYILLNQNNFYQLQFLRFHKIFITFSFSIFNLNFFLTFSHCFLLFSLFSLFSLFFIFLCFLYFHCFFQNYLFKQTLPNRVRRTPIFLIVSFFLWCQVMPHYLLSGEVAKAYRLYNKNNFTNQQCAKRLCRIV